MLNGRAILIGILYVLFVTSAALGQSQSGTGVSNSALLELQLTIIKEINASKDVIRDHVDKSEEDTLKYIDDKFSKLNDKFSKLDKEVAVLNNAKWYIGIIVAPISIYCSILLLQMLRQWISDRKTKVPLKDTPPSKESDVDIDDFLDNTQPDYLPTEGKS